MIIKRGGHVFFSATKAPIKIRLWNIQTVEYLDRSLKLWLDGEINEGEKIKKIERFVSYISIADENNPIQRMWVRVKDDDDDDVKDMMFGSDEIVLLVVIS